MRRRYCTITSAVVRASAAAGLRSALPWQPFGRLVSVTSLVDLLLLTAALRSSLSAVVQRFRFGFSHETARRAVRVNLPPLEHLAAGLVDALHGYLPRVFRRRAWEIALDLHYVPYYGRARTPGTQGGPKKHGSNRFVVYATAVIVQRGQRWCLGLVPVSTTRPDQAVTALVEQRQARRVPIRCLVLDRGFFSGHVVRALQARQVPFVLGVARKGGRIDRLFELPSGQVTTHAWKTQRGALPVAVAVVAVRRRVRGRWRREAYAFSGIRPPKAVRRYQRARYDRQLNQRRFGIETSYRQMNQGKARTTSTDQRLRLLWLGVALLLRQVWVWLQQQATPHGVPWKHWRPLPTLRLSSLLDWLAGQLQQRHPAYPAIPLPRPMELPATMTLKR